MKHIFVICTLISLSYAFVVENNVEQLEINGVHEENEFAEFDASSPILENHVEQFEINGEHEENEFAEFDDRMLEQDQIIGKGEIVAVINTLADKVLANIEVLARRGGMDPMPLYGFDDNFLLARVTLSDGELDGVSSVERNGDVILTYRSDNKLTVHVPIKFTHITFRYKFYVFLILLGHTGHVAGGIDKMKMNVELIIDLNTYKGSLSKLNMMDSGHVSVHVEGGIIEAVISILSELITTVIHPIIVAVIQEVVRNVLSGVIKTINDGVDHMLHPNATTLLF